jgi:hypothetical protein
MRFYVKKKEKDLTKLFSCSIFVTHFLFNLRNPTI